MNIRSKIEGNQLTYGWWDRILANLRKHLDAYIYRRKEKLWQQSRGDWSDWNELVIERQREDLLSGKTCLREY